MGAPSIPQLKTPPPPVDYADQAVRDAALTQRQRSMTGSRRRSFLTGSYAGPVSRPFQQKAFLGT